MRNILLITVLIATPFISKAQCLVSLIGKNSVACNGLCNDTLTARPTGGLAPYTYSWEPNVSTDSVATGLCAGTYMVTTTDDNGCIASATFTITQPQKISTTAIVIGSSCSGNCDGDITMTVSGGTTPYTYSWYYGDVTKDLHSICPGTYCVAITDSNGCRIDTCFKVAEGPFIFLGPNVRNVSCVGLSDGEISLDVGGGKAPYKYFWFSTNDSTATSDSLFAGNYCVQVTDSTGCGNQACLDVLEPLPFSITATITQPKCYGGTDGCLSMTVTGGNTPYTYLWNSGATTKNICPTHATFYSVDITDSLGCKTDTSFNIDQPDLLDITLTATNTSCIGCIDGKITSVISGGTATFQYLWVPNITTASSASGLVPGLYQVCVKDINNCLSCDTITVYDDPTFIRNDLTGSLKIYPSPAKDQLWVMSDELGINSTVEINNLLGENVYSTQLISPIDVSTLPKGIYFVKIISDRGEVIAARKIMIE